MKYFNKSFFNHLKGNLKVMKEKTIKRIAIFSLTTLLLVSGCSPDKTTNKQASNSDNFYYESTIMPSTPSQSATNSVDIKTSLSEEELKLLEQETSLSELEYSKFISDIHSLPVEYENSEYFQIQQAFSRYENIKEYDTGIKWNDKELNIQWITTNPIVSEKDSKLMSFSEFKKNFKFKLYE